MKEVAHPNETDRVRLVQLCFVMSYVISMPEIQPIPKKFNQASVQALRHGKHHLMIFIK